MLIKLSVWVKRTRSLHSDIHDRSSKTLLPDFFHFTRYNTVFQVTCEAPDRIDSTRVIWTSLSQAAYAGARSSCLAAPPQISLSRLPPWFRRAVPLLLSQPSFLHSFGEEASAKAMIVLVPVASLWWLSSHGFWWQQSFLYSEFCWLSDFALASTMSQIVNLGSFKALRVHTYTRHCDWPLDDRLMRYIDLLDDCLINTCVVVYITRERELRSAGCVFKFEFDRWYASKLSFKAFSSFSKNIF